MDLDNKTVVCIGDSITLGCGASDFDHGWVGLLQKNHPNAKVFNCGIGGTRFAVKTFPSEIVEYDIDFISRIDSLPNNADLVLVAGGTNDFGSGDASLGNMDSISDHSFYGALKIVAEKLINKYPTARIVYVTPLHTVFERYKDFPDGTFTLKDFVNAIREVAEYYSFPVLDLFKNSGICPQVEVQKNLFMPRDGLHPDNNGYKRINEIVETFIKYSI